MSNRYHLALAAAITLAPSAWAADLFVDQAKGNDAFSGKSVDQPFATISKAAAVAEPGDVVHVRNGVYREAIRPENSGRPGAPITFQPYQNEQVVISGAQVIDAWSPAGAPGLFKTSLPANFFQSSINQSDQLFIDGQMVHLARWPNLGDDISRPTKSTITKFVSKDRDKSRNITTSVFEDANIPAGADFTGAEVYIQPNREGWGWTLSGKVVAHAGKQLTIETHSGTGVDGQPGKYHEGARYYVHNQRDLLDVPGEWYHDKSSGTLYLRLPNGSSPQGKLIEAKKRDYAFDLTGRTDIVVKDLHLFAASLTTDNSAGGDSIGYDAAGKERYPWRDKNWIAPARRIVVDGVDAKYLNHFTDVSGHFFLQRPPNTGIVLAGEDHVIRNSRIQYAAGNGISLQGRRHRAVNNEILATNYMSTDCAPISTGTNTPTYDVQIAYNTIRNTARSGMTLRRLENSDPANLVTRIHHNDVSEYGLQDWDVGAFYTFGQDGKFTRIDHNFFHCSHDNAKGMFHGAYWDFSKNYVLDHNVIWGVAKPIQVTKTFDDKGARINNLLIYNNTAISNDTPWGRPMEQNGGNGSIVRNNLMKVNVFEKPGGGLINHWPTYGNGRAAHNVLFGANPAGNNPVDKSLFKTDVYAADVAFVNPAQHDYRLNPASPALKAGTRMEPITLDGITVPPYHDTDLPNPAAGAYEDGHTTWRVGADLAQPME